MNQSAFKRFVAGHDLAVWLFILAVVVYVATRLIGLTNFPIYFFTDEAIQSQSIADLVNNHYRDLHEVLLPTYFRNGEYYNLGLSVYLQWLPYLLFGKSAFITRAASVSVTLIAAIAVGLILRDVFKIKYWWSGTLFLSITPSWFLHSRTAFETAEFVSLYAGALCCYLRYRYGSPRYLYLTVFLAALSFYSYNPAQLIVPLTAICLFLSDWHHHWENRRTLLIGLLLVGLLALPYLRFIIGDPNASVAHLHTMGSYLTQNLSLAQKVARYGSEYGIGLSPWYWYIPNERDLPRHLMKDYGNIMLITLPFALLGLAYLLRNLRQSSHRTILIAILVSPTAAALVQTSITRALVFVIPAAIITAIGFDLLLSWIEDSAKAGSELNGESVSASRGLLPAFGIFAIGIALAVITPETINKVAILTLTALLALSVTGWTRQLASRLSGKKFPLPSHALVSWTAFAILGGANIFMLNDALRNGPLWFPNYGMSGMQYGAFQIYDVIARYAQQHPGTQIVLSPNWANGADTVTRFFLGNPAYIQLGSIEGYITRQFPLDDHTLFVMTPEEFKTAGNSNKLTDIQVEQIISFPNGSPGFYFVHLRYVDQIDQIFAQEKAAHEILRESTVMIDGQEVKVRFSFLDTSDQEKAIALVFDNDPYSLTKTFEDNPFIIEMNFPSPRIIHGFSIVVGSVHARITLKCYPAQDMPPVIYSFTGLGTIQVPRLSFDFPKPIETELLRIEMSDQLSAPTAQIHIWEIQLR